MLKREFVKRRGTKLVAGEIPYRFAGPNIYWLGLDENVEGIDWPTPFRIQNVLDTAVMMGANALRSHTLAASVGHPKSLMPTLRQMNEEAWVKVDFALDEIAKRGLRVMIPLVCNWSYYHGGRSTFTSWRGIEDAEDFYYDRQVIADFQWYIGQILNRTNTINGLMYKDDPSILAWELGNELNDVPADWVQEMCRYIKGIDSNHLISHGKQFEVDADKLDIPELDIIDVHYYPPSAEQLHADVDKVSSAGKVYIAGEYDWSSDQTGSFLQAVESNEKVSGTFFWSLFGHHDQGGYVQHNDGFSVHYPGHGYSDVRLGRIQALRQHAYQLRQARIPEILITEAPLILSTDEGRIVFRGVAGSATYTLERSSKSPSGPWQPVIERQAYHNGEWKDALRVKEEKVYYRIKAITLNGVEGPCSQPVESLAF
ncbi:cellulase family glycosylhydrolase [Paenibacillus hunanensis]|uniref:cellulase family glycosylhydrolase n=1 Tax=Paenibacillus hunanensis TaxID=539262 RepID=UPI002026E3B1|nr:cellulase family glycosylhydrolase [Paenibacillus hunanensis]MCL9662654.1 cellulase family glycosylhydrolase [Paenibacillus hunanensis]